jgi:hypothetical protein
MSFALVLVGVAMQVGALALRPSKVTLVQPVVTCPPVLLAHQPCIVRFRYVNPAYLSEASWPRIRAKFAEDGSVQLQRFLAKVGFGVEAGGLTQLQCYWLASGMTCQLTA